MQPNREKKTSQRDHSRLKTENKFDEIIFFYEDYQFDMLQLKDVRIMQNQIKIELQLFLYRSMG